MRPIVPEGVSVKYAHHRYLNPTGKGVSPKGGWTTATLYRKVSLDGEQVDTVPRVIGTGIAYCHLNDNFNRKIGRDIALGRALKNAGLR
jgi:hypothetical protein